MAEKELFARFQGTELLDTYRMIKIRELETYESLLEQSRAHLALTRDAVYSILNDAVFFPATGNDSFAIWADKNDFSSIVQLLKWLIQDFQYVESLKLDLDGVFSKINEICISIARIDLDVLVTGNKLTFVDPAGIKQYIETAEIDSEIKKNWIEHMDIASRH